MTKFLAKARIAGLVILALNFTGISYAQAGDWILKKSEKAFGEREAIAMAVGDSSIAFVTCNGDGLSVNLATPEDWKDDYFAVNALSPRLIVAIDGGETVRYDVTLGENGLHKLLAATADEDVAKDVAENIASAKKKIDIGIELGGKKFHTSRLSAAGTKVRSVLEMCAAQKKSDTGSDKKN